MGRVPSALARQSIWLVLTTLMHNMSISQQSRSTCGSQFGLTAKLFSNALRIEVLAHVHWTYNPPELANQPPDANEWLLCRNRNKSDLMRLHRLQYSSKVICLEFVHGFRPKLLSRRLARLGVQEVRIASSIACRSACANDVF